MTPGTRTLSAPLSAAGASDAGLQRDVNEDRYHLDLVRGIFIVVDGVGGQAAGGKAADIALATLKIGLARETVSAERRLREAITAANNEIHRTAGLRPEWNGMACVLTAVVVEDSRAVVGHVGDTRLYKLRGGGIQKVTRDHSPVGEREDQGEITETEARNHPRRHEVYRDVGSDLHAAADDEFVDVYEIAFEPDAALLLCSDGLTDLVDSSEVRQAAAELAGQPKLVVKRLVDAANRAGGKDNVTVVYVEGERFAARMRDRDTSPSEITRRRTTTTSPPAAELESGRAVERQEHPRSARSRLAVGGFLALILAAGVVATYPYWSGYLEGAVSLPPSRSSMVVVQPSDSIAAAIDRAEPGAQVLVEPGEYRERINLRRDVTVTSRVPRGATLRLPGAARDSDAAVVASGVTGASLIGFRIVGDAATPLGTAVLVSDAAVSVMDVEISGAAHAALDVRGRSHLNLVGSVVQSGPGAALALARGATSRITQNLFTQNGTSSRMAAPMVIDASANVEFSGNVFVGLSRNAFAGLSEAARTRVAQHNVFIAGGRGQ